MTRLELLHTIQDNAELLTLGDAVALVAGRLPTDDKAVIAAWGELTLRLIANAAVGC